MHAITVIKCLNQLFTLCGTPNYIHSGLYSMFQHMLLRNFRYCTITPMMKIVCYSSHFVLSTVALFGLIPLHLVLDIQKRVTTETFLIRNLLLPKTFYSASTMFVTHGIPSFLRTTLHYDVNALKPRISKMHNVQETQKKLFQNKLATECLLLLFDP